MSKLSSALFSFSAKGSIGKALSFRRKGSQTIAEKMPIPEDAKSLAQLSWRHMYQKAVALWHLLSTEEKAEWESNARIRHMTGFAWFMSQCLKPNPGIYLPLQGGIMQGDIDMATHKITDLPQPTLDQHAATKKYADDLPVKVHGAAKHTDVTRELFVPVGPGYTTASAAYTSNYGVYTFADGELQNYYITTKVPDDFVSFASVKAIWSSPPASGNMYWALKATYAAEDEVITTHLDAPVHGVTPTGGVNKFNVQEPANPLTLANIAKGDQLGLRFYRFASNALDTLNTYVYLYGFLFTYTAEQ